MDNWGYTPPDWPVETWTNWSDIPSDILSKSECLLTYFEGSDLVYFLPAFITQFLQESEATHPSFSHAVDCLFMSLTWWRRSDYLGITFTKEQRQLVDDVFEFGSGFQELRRTIEAS